MSPPYPQRVRVVPDVAAIAKTFDYAVPDAWHRDGRAARLAVGTMVRVVLHGRRVAAWVVAVDPPADPARPLAPLTKLSGVGPPAELVALAEWAAWRWAGALASILGTASPATMIERLPAPRSRPRPAVTNDDVRRAFAGPGAVVRLPPATDPFPLVLGAAGCGNALVLVPAVETAIEIGRRLGARGVEVAVHPQGWAYGAAGATVVGSRAAAFAPVADLAAVLVIDEHDEAYQQEQAPTWHARDVVLERARRAGVPCVLASPHPTVEALDELALITLARSTERAGWPRFEVVDAREEPPGQALTPAALVRLLRTPGRVACVVNRAGRATLLACAVCGTLALCPECDARMTQPGDGRLVCAAAGHETPVVCAACGSARLKTLRAGTRRLREELTALGREPVLEVTAATSAAEARRARLLVGTEAVLHRAGPLDAVAFLDFDQELTAPRYRAGEEALALLSRAGRLVGGRAGTVLVVTHQPAHPVIRAAAGADPDLLTQVDRARRRLLNLPPFVAMAQISGPASAEFVARLGQPPGLEIRGPRDGSWLVKAADHAQLSDALGAVARPKGRLRIAVDPLRV